MRFERFNPTLKEAIMRMHNSHWNLVLVIVLLFVTVQVSWVSGAAPARVSLLIRYKNPPGLSEEMFVRQVGGHVKYRYHLVNAMAVSIPETVVPQLIHDSRIAKIEPDLPIRAADEELDNSWGVTRIGAGNLHQESITGEGIGIAIIDSGINYNHPDLPKFTPDPSGSYYAGGYDFIENDDDPMDVYGHGTHVAGIACALDNGNGDPDGSYGVVGVAPACALYSLRVLDDAGWGNSSDLIAALQWALDEKIPVANLSLGWDRYPGETVEEAFYNAEQQGMVIVAAACNNGKWHGRGENVCYPGKFPSVIAVAATDSKDIRASFSSTGPEVELAAPGVSVLSTWNDDSGYALPEPVCRTEDGVQACYKFGSGTSMASPHVAGTAALMIQSGSITDLNSNGRINDEIRQILIDTADDLGDAGWDPWYGYGLVNNRQNQHLHHPLHQHLRQHPHPRPLH
jgi:subtilisin